MQTQSYFNPYLPDRNTGIPPVFIGRSAEIARLHNGLYAAANLPALVITGPHRIGKTMLLRHMESTLPESAVGVYFSWQNVPRKWPVIIAQAVAQRIGQDSLSHNAIEQIDEAARWLRESVITQTLQLIRPAHNLIFFFDDVGALFKGMENGSLPQHTLTDLEDMLRSHNTVRAVFAFSLDDEPYIAQAPSLFNHQDVLRLSLFTTIETNAMLNTPVQAHYQLDVSALRSVTASTGSHPYLTGVFAAVIYEHWHKTPAAAFSAENVLSLIPEVSSITEEFLTLLWLRLSPLEQAVISAVAELTYADPFRKITAPTVQEWLVSTDHPIDLTAVNAILRSLEYQDILQQTHNGIRVTGNLLQNVIRQSHQITSAPHPQRSTPAPASATRLGSLWIAVTVLTLLLLVYLASRNTVNINSSSEQSSPVPTVTLVQSE